MEENARSNSFLHNHIANQHNNADLQPNTRNAGKSCSHFLLKFFVIALFLSVLPFFPSDPPEFISQTIFAKSWELIHLLVIGIALSYGLFCRPKTAQVAPNLQSSQPFASNILHHSSIFNYDEGNPCTFSDNNAIPTKSFDLSCYGKEPFVDFRRVNFKSFDEKPLGLPVRSLRSRVLDSDSDSDSEEEQDDCTASDCESDLSDNNCSNVKRSVKDEKLESNLGSFSPIITTTQYGPTEIWSRGSFSPITTTTQYGPTEVWSRGSFSPTTTTTTQYDPTEMRSRGSFSPITTTTTQYGPTEVGSRGSFSPILCKSQSMRSDYYIAENSKVEAKQVKFQSFRSPVQEASSCQKVAGFCSWLPESPNMMERDYTQRENNFYMPFSNFTQVNDFNMVGLSPNSQSTSTNFFMPSAVSPSMPFSAGEFASSYSKYTHENEHSSNPQFMNGHMSVENSGFFMPSAAAPFPLSVPASDFGSMSRRYNYEAENWSRSPNLQGGILGGEYSNSFVPTAAFPSSMPSCGDDLAQSAAFPPSMPSCADDLAQSAAFPPSMPSSADDLAQSAAFPPSMPSSADDLAQSVAASEGEKFNRGSSSNTKDKSKSNNHNGREAYFKNQINPVTPNFIDLFSAGKSPDLENGESGVKQVKPSVFSPVNVSATSRSENFILGPSLQKNEGKSEKKNVDGKKVESSVFNSVNECAALQNADYQHGPSVQKDEERSETHNVGVEKLNPSVLTFVNEFAALRGAKYKFGPSVQKDEEKSEKHNVATLASNREENISSTPQLVDPLSIPTPKLVVSPKKDEQRTSPERWDDDCFVIPLSEDNDKGDDFVQENPTLELSDSFSEAPSSARTSSRKSFHEKNLPREEVEENVQWSLPTTNSEIEDLAVDNESYKPSTPSPPPEIQTRRNNLSVDSSSKALGNRSLVNNDDQRSPPTPERKKALMKASHSRRFSCGPFFDRDLRKSFKDEAKESNRKTKGDHQFAKGGKCGCLMLDVKPAFNKATLKGKSVRTIRPKEISNDQQKNDHKEGKHKGDNAGERKGENHEMVVIKIGISEKRPNSNDRKGEKLQGGGATSILVGLNSNGTAVVPIVHEVEEENDSEIDKKADEFIAKFKEQIRLQKFNSKGESSRHQKFMYHT